MTSASLPFQPPAPASQVQLAHVLMLVALVLVGAIATVMSEHPEVVGAFFAAVWVPLAARTAIASDRRGGADQVVEIGTVYLAIVGVYTLYPLLSYIVGDYGYSPLNDSRLFSAQPPPAEIARIAWCYVLYSAAFSLVYVAVRRNSPPLRIRGLVMERSLVTALVALLLLTRGLLLAVTLVYGSAGDSYYDEYLRFAAAPQIVRQAAGHLQGMIYVLQVAVVLVLVARFSKYKWVLLAWIVAEVAILAVGLGARSNLAVLLLAAAIAYSWLVRPISMISLLSLGVVGIIGFVILGIARSGGLQSLAEGALIASGEFEAVFANAYEVSSLKDTGQAAGLTVTTYLGDFLAIVPQQLLPFAKTNLSQWYLETFYFEVAEQGGGFAFGAVAESFVGLGVVDIVWRAMLLGWLFGLLHRYTARNSTRFWVVLFCLWMTVFSYLCFRVSTFTPFARMVYHFAPAYLSVGLVMVVLRTVVMKARGLNPAGVVAR